MNQKQAKFNIFNLILLQTKFNIIGMISGREDI